MSAAPYDICRYFNADEDLKVVEVFWGEDWIPVPVDHQSLNATLLVLWYKKGITKIAVEHEWQDRTVEFDLRGVILRDGSDNPTERVQ